MREGTDETARVDGLRFPVWLYWKRDGEYDTVWRIGSRRPLRVCLTVLKGKEPFALPTQTMFCIGRFGLNWGGSQGVWAGLDGFRNRSRVWTTRSNRAVAVYWEQPRKPAS